MYPKITDEGIEASITFLEKQKLANCPCIVHTEHRGFGWIVFRRQPDRITCDSDDIPDIEDDVTDEEEFFSAEIDDSIIIHTTDDELTIPADDPQYSTCIVDKLKNASGAASENDITSADLSAGYKAIADPQESDSPSEPSLHSRDTNIIHSKNQRNEQKKKNGNNKNGASSMDLGVDSNKKEESKTEGKPKKSRGHYYNPWCTY